MVVWWIVPGFVPILTLVPRFILNLRTLCARDVEGRYGTAFDTAFGLTFIGLGAAATSTAYADGGQDVRESEQDEDVATEERRMYSVSSAA